MIEFQESSEPFSLDFSEPEEVSTNELLKAGLFTGIIRELTNEDYHAAHEYLSFSGAKAFAKAPAYYPAYLRKENEETPARRIGTGVHMRVLEPNRFSTGIVTVTNRVTKENKERIAQAEAEGKWVLNVKEYDQICKMSDSILKDPLAASLLKGGVAESSIFWKDAKSGVNLKCRPDYLRDDGVIVDLKTYGEDMDDDALMRQVMKMKYHYQSAMYLDGVGQLLGRELNMFAHVFVGDEDPYLVRVIVLNDAALDKARFDLDELFQRFAECKAKNVWPGFNSGITEVTLPDWAW